jgi:hypothetical protein
MIDQAKAIDEERWLCRVEDLAELRDEIKRLPVAARRILKQGPVPEPGCGVCFALAAVNGCASFAEVIRDYHECGVVAMAQALDVEYLDQLVEHMTEKNDKLVRDLAGILSAERCLTIYLIAGWTPPRIRKRART